MIRKEEGSDPASVIFDAVVEARKRNADILICDTAGRLREGRRILLFFNLRIHIRIYIYVQIILFTVFV